MTHDGLLRHDNKVAIQMLEVHGGLRQSDPRTEELVVHQIKQAKLTERKQREETVKEMLDASVEQVPVCATCICLVESYVCKGSHGYCPHVPRGDVCCQESLILVCKRHAYTLKTKACSHVE